VRRKAFLQARATAGIARAGFANNCLKATRSPDGTRTVTEIQVSPSFPHGYSLTAGKSALTTVVLAEIVLA
jgi:hypothetical protein